MMRHIVGAALLGILLSGPANAQPASHVGGVSRLAGRCEGGFEGKTVPLEMASAVFLGQVVTTAARSRLEITFDDDTLLTLGEQVKLTIDDFVYRPDRNRIALAIDGAMRFISSVRKPANADFSVATPVGKIDIRGTDFWSGPIDGKYGVLLLKGAVRVSNAAGEAVLDAPGEGVNIAGPNVAPGPVTQWPADKVRRALAAVEW